MGTIEIQLIRKQQAVCKYNKINATVCKYYVTFNVVFNIFGNDDIFGNDENQKKKITLESYSNMKI